MNFTEAISVCFSKYFTFTGRARRSEYWYFYLFTLIGNLLLTLIDAAIFGDVEVLSSVFALAVTIPTLAAGTRRLHDTNRSGWFQLLPIIAIPLLLPGIFLMQTNEMVGIGLLVIAGLVLLGASITLLVWYASEGDPTINNYGPPTSDSSGQNDHFETIFE